MSGDELPRTVCSGRWAGARSARPVSPGHGGNSAALGEQQGHAMRDISASGSISVGFGGYLSGSGIFKPVGSHKVTVIRGTWDNNWSSTNYGLDLSAGGVPVANEVRPDNQAVRYLIRAIP